MGSDGGLGCLSRVDCDAVQSTEFEGKERRSRSSNEKNRRHPSMNFTTPPTKLGRIVSLCVRVAVVCILLASATGILLWLTANRRVPSSSDPAAPDRSVEVVSVAPRGVARTWVGYGVAEAVNTVDVPSEVSSIVIEIPDSIDIGRTIMAGDLIAQLDSEDFHSTVGDRASIPAGAGNPQGTS